MRFKLHCSYLTVLLLCAPSFSADGSMFRGDARHTGVYNATGVPKFSAVKWKFHTGGQVLSSPAVVSGTVFVGSTDGNLYAVDQESGTQKWKFEAKSRVVSSPAVADGVGDFAAYDGNFYAVDAGGGQLKWKFKTQGERRFAGTPLHGSQPVAESIPDPFDCYLS